MTTEEKALVVKKIKKLLGPCRVVYYPNYDKPANSWWIVEETTDYHEIGTGHTDDEALIEALEYAKENSCF